MNTLKVEGPKWAKAESTWTKAVFKPFQLGRFLLSVTQGLGIHNARRCSWRRNVFVKEWFYSVRIGPNRISFNLALWLKKQGF